MQHLIPEQYVRLASTPASPPAGFVALYFKTDGILYQLNSAGTETAVASGGVPTIPDGSITNQKLAQSASAHFKGVQIGGSPQDIGDLNMTEATSMLEVFGGSNQGVVPACGVASGNYLRDDGSWAIPDNPRVGEPQGYYLQDDGNWYPISIVPAGADGEFQYNAGGALAGNDVLRVRDGLINIRPARPVALPDSGTTVYLSDELPTGFLETLSANGIKGMAQNIFSRNNVAIYAPNGNATTLTYIGTAAWSALGTAAAYGFTPNSTTGYQKNPGILEYNITTAVATAVAGISGAATRRMWSGYYVGDGGFYVMGTFGFSTGCATATHRGFFGLNNGASAPTDVNPSTKVSSFGFGWDNGDTTISFMSNGTAGTATKVDTGIPVPTVDRTKLYRAEFFVPPCIEQNVHAPIYYRLTDTTDGTIFSGIFEDVAEMAPAGTNYQLQAYHSAGGTSSVIGMAMGRCYTETFAR